MIFQLFRPNPLNRSMTPLYGAIVAQARQEAFYRDYRYRIRLTDALRWSCCTSCCCCVGSVPAPKRGAGQILFDLFCRDMDGNLREMGIGDLAVPREMQRIGEAFYGRQAAYETALSALDREALAAALARNVFGSAPGLADELAAYVISAVHALADQDTEALNRGEMRFPDPTMAAGISVAAGRVG